MSRDILEMAREAKVSIRGHYDETGSTPQELKRLVELARAEEREACAKVADGFIGGDVIADKIRARGQA